MLVSYRDRAALSAPDAPSTQQNSGRGQRPAAWQLCCALPLLLACSHLPGYAKPSGSLVDPQSVDRSDLITYRQLKPSDFKAKRPPPEAAGHAQQLGALTCAYLLTTPDTQYEVEQRASRGTAAFSGRLTQLQYIAYMDRKCSWWNSNHKQAQDYILQHEQVHFALAEVAARRLNRRVPEIIKALHVEGGSAQEINESIRQRLRDILRDAQRQLLDRHHDFDEDTSAQNNVEGQRRWAEKVFAELESLDG